VLTSNVPDREQYAMAFVIARTILVWFSKIAKTDWAVGCSNYL
jgi:hypothetical protein